MWESGIVPSMWLTNHRRARAARVTVLGVSVCLSVTLRSGSTGSGVECDSPQRCDLFDLNWAFLKRPCAPRVKWRMRSASAGYGSAHPASKRVWSWDHKTFL